MKHFLKKRLEKIRVWGSILERRERKFLERETSLRFITWFSSVNDLKE